MGNWKELFKWGKLEIRKYTRHSKFSWHLFLSGSMHLWIIPFWIYWNKLDIAKQTLYTFFEKLICYKHLSINAIFSIFLWEIESKSWIWTGKKNELFPLPAMNTLPTSLSSFAFPSMCHSPLQKFSFRGKGTIGEKIVEVVIVILWSHQSNKSHKIK